MKKQTKLGIKKVTVRDLDEPSLDKMVAAVTGIGVCATVPISICNISACKTC